jgi:hypothetical protein
MKFHLGFQPQISPTKITHLDALVMMGSCFSEHIGNRLNDLKFDVNSNPFGIVFNPKSIEASLQRIIHKIYFTSQDVFEKEGQWFCLEAHSLIGSADKQALISKLNAIIDLWHDKLKTARFLMITFGSAYAYKSKASDNIVANCHKLPQSLFQKTLLETPSIVFEYHQLINALKQFNVKLQIVFTVSPVKHLRDGVVENSLSKSILIQSVHQLIKENSNCTYFPAYELVNDDLRDYRFYEADLAHPNKLAIDYVWQRFSDSYFNEEVVTLNEKLYDIKQAVQHRLLNEESELSISFKKKFYQKCLSLQHEFPFLNLNNELAYFSK